MQAMMRWLLALMLLAVANPLFAQFDIVERTFDADESLISALKKGGFVLYFRHGATHHDQPDREHVNFDDCSTQRNLSRRGRSQVRSIGMAFDGLSIPVNKVYSSPFCRCTETAELAFGKYQIVNELAFDISSASLHSSGVKQVLRAMLATIPQGGNTIIISHTANLKEATGIWPKPEAVIVLFRPTAGGVVEYYGKVMPEYWQQLSHNQN